MGGQLVAVPRTGTIRDGHSLLERIHQTAQRRSENRGTGDAVAWRPGVNSWNTDPLPRWDARTWAIKATPKDGRPIAVPVASYYPYSGQTGKDGVTGPLVYAGSVPSDGSHPPDLSGDLKGKIVFVDYPIVARHYEKF